MNGGHETVQASGIWRTPGPYLGLAMGVGTPLVLLVYARAGWIAALAAVLITAAFAAAVLRRFKREDLVRAYGSPALVRYNHRFLLATLGYALGILIAILIYNQGSAQDPLPRSALFAVSLLPTLPALAMIFVMGRYLIEETDEYLRHRASLAAIIGLGLILTLGTVWGFLETFGLVPHVWAWWVVPAWALGLGLGQAILARSERAREPDDQGQPDDQGKDTA